MGLVLDIIYPAIIVAAAIYLGINLFPAGEPCLSVVLSRVSPLIRFERLPRSIYN